MARSRAVPARTLLLLALVPALLGWGCGGERQVPSAREGARPAPRAPASATVVPVAGVPRRDLSLDERRGGHTLARHVGRTDADLRERLSRERRISAASTYTDREAAERSVGAALSREGAALSRWAARAGSRPNLVLDFRGDGTIGRSLRRGARAPVPCTGAVVVLKWDERRGDWYVLTSYPEASR